MPLYPTHRFGNSHRSGKVLVLFIILLPVLLGMLALVIDLSLLLSYHREVQNAADAAALAAATQLFQDWGYPYDTAQVETNATNAAITVVHHNNGLSRATVAVKFYDQIDVDPYRSLYGPSSNYGSNYGRTLYQPDSRGRNFVEVVVTYTVDTLFAGVFGADTSTMKVRAVAGFEPPGWPEGAGTWDNNDPRPYMGEGIITLDSRSTAIPGLHVTNAELQVKGSVVVNSPGSGEDQYTQPVNWGDSPYALRVNRGATLLARYIQVRGGVDNLANYQPYDAGGTEPVFCRGPIVPDPLSLLPVPSASTAPGLTYDPRPGMRSIEITAGTHVYGKPGDPRIFDYINIKGGNVTFMPGVYIVRPMKDTPPDNMGIFIGQAATVKTLDPGVMFYNTTLNVKSNGQKETFVYETGKPDIDDKENPPRSSGTGFLPVPSPITIEPTLGPSGEGSVDPLLGLKNALGRPYKILFYQRRWNEGHVRIGGSASATLNMNGVIYGKWALARIARPGTYPAQFVVGSMRVSASDTVIIDPSGSTVNPPLAPLQPLKTANKVFLVQ